MGQKSLDQSLNLLQCGTFRTAEVFLALNDVLTQAIKEALLKHRDGEVALWNLICAGHPGSNSGTFQIDNLAGAMAKELSVVLKGELEPSQEHTAISMVLPCEPPDVEPLDGASCSALTMAGKPCKLKPWRAGLCSKHYPKPTASSGNE